MRMARYEGDPSTRATLNLRSAAIFGYLEEVVHLADPAKLSQVIAFLNSFTEFFPTAGFEIAMVEMFMDSAMELLEQMRLALERQALDEALAILLRTMNDDQESNTIVYYFKVSIPTNPLQLSFLLRI